MNQKKQDTVDRFKAYVVSKDWVSAHKQIPELSRRFPDNGQLWYLFGDICSRVGDSRNAIICLEHAVKLVPEEASYHSLLAQCLVVSGDLERAADQYSTAVKLNDADMPTLVMDFFHNRDIARWDGCSGEDVASKVLAQEAAIPALIMLLAEDNPEQQKLHSSNFARSRGLNTTGSRPEINDRSGGRIHVGFFSADIHAHATSYLISGLLRHLDRTRFDVTVYSYGPVVDDWSRKIAADADNFVDGSKIDDRELAAMARKDKLDIAIDLKGYTQHTRLGMFREGVAPVQITYLGYPGTLASPCFDYAIVDKTVVPASEREHYTEKLIYLPHSYQCTDCERPVSKKQTTRADWSLPDNATVLFCFNHAAKICPKVFSIWMNVLNNRSETVLWLLEDNKWARANFQRTAELHGVNPERLVFAPKVPQGEHLERLRHADLFLDTFAYNAHTTASDVLYMGIPLVTRAGRQFAARVGASLLKAVELPDLVTETDTAYQDLILDLLDNPHGLRETREKLENNRLQAPLFDTARFTRNFERGLLAAWQKAVDGEKPNDIEVTE